MASFKRSELREILGEAYTDDIGNRLVALHLGVVDPMKDDLAAAKAEIEKYKAEADKVPGIQKELDGYKNGEDFKSKYDAEHQAFEDYKAQVRAEAEQARVKAAYRQLLTEEKISEKRLDAVIRLTDFSGMKLDKDGKLENADGLRKTIQSDWADYIQSADEKGAKVDAPPKTDTNTFDSMSLADKMAYANQHPAAPEVVGWLNK